MKQKRNYQKAIVPSYRYEKCTNPWNGRCESNDIALYILYEGKKLPICKFCWSKIAERDLEWGDGIDI